MDFRLKGPEKGGLNIGLLAGINWIDASHAEAVHIHEDAFWFLERAIFRHCATYTWESHYGVTEIPRESWERILVEWKHLAEELQSVQLTTDLRILRDVPKYVRTAFIRDLRRNCLRLSRLLSAVIQWVNAATTRHEIISVLGI
jgi:hypothetical protein